MKKISIMLAVILAAASVASAQSGRVKANYAACLTEQLLDELTTASVKQDLRHVEYLLNSGCAIVGGREFSIIDRGWSTSKIRVYVDGDAVALYVLTDAIR